MLRLLRRAPRIARLVATSCPSPSPSPSALSLPANSIRPFTSYIPHAQKSMPSRPKPPPDSEIEESYLKGSGPGGQKINKTNSAVQIKHIPTGIVVKSQATRSRAQNRTHAREILAQKLDHLRNGDQSRVSIVGQVKKKRADSAAKKSRRKYKRLDEEKAASTLEAVKASQTTQAEPRDATVAAQEEHSLTASTPPGLPVQPAISSETASDASANSHTLDPRTNQ